MLQPIPHPRRSLPLLLAALFANVAHASTPPNEQLTVSFEEKIDLGTLKSDNGGQSLVRTLSTDGKVAVGAAYDDAGNYNRAVLWSESGGQAPTDLGTLKKDNSGASEVIAIASSTDGTVVAAGGWANDDAGNFRRAVLWSGADLKTKTDLGTTRADNSGWSEVHALTVRDDGTVVAGGWASGEVVGGTPHRAVLWSGPDWKAIPLETLRTDKKGWSEVRALSADGKVAGGWTNDDTGTTPISAYGHQSENKRAVLWKGPNWQAAPLGGLRSDNSGFSEVRALSADGTVAGGDANDDAGNNRAVLWSGDDWKTKTDLGTLRSDNSGESAVRALSADGTVAGGWADEETGKYFRAVLWSGDGWKTKTDLGTLKSDNSGDSLVFALSADGSVAGGRADDDEGNFQAVLWKLRYSRNGTGVTAPETASNLPAGGLHGTGTTAPALPAIDPNTLVSVGRPVDVKHTRTILQRLGGDTLAAADMQREALRRVREHCGTQQQGELCYRIQGDVARLDDVRDTAATFTLGYGISNQLTAGASFSRSLNRTLGDTYRSGNRNNHALGVFAEYRIPFDGGAWFVRPNAGWNSYRVHAVRPVLPNTEAGEGEHRLKAASAGIEFGQQFGSDSGRELAWHAGLEYSRIKRNGYTETNADFPVTFGDLSYRDTALLLGAQAQWPLTANLKALLRADGAYSLSTERPQYTAHADYIGDFVYEGRVSRARGTLSAGLSYRFGPAVSAFVTPYVGKTIGGEMLRGASFGLKGRF